MKNAFSYMFKDEKFWQKALMYFLIVFVANVLLYYSVILPSKDPVTSPFVPLIAHLIMMINIGYGFTLIKAIMEQPDEMVLPSVNVLPNLWLGFKYSVSVLLIVLVIAIVGALIIPFVVTMPVVNAISILLLIVAFLVFFMAFRCLFAQKGMITTYFRFPTAIKMIKENLSKYFVAVLLYSVLIVLVGVINFAVMSVFGGLVSDRLVVSLITGFIVSILATYMVFVNSYITAKAVKPVSAE